MDIYQSDPAALEKSKSARKLSGKLTVAPKSGTEKKSSPVQKFDKSSSKKFKGIVNVDIRDSVPDWEPYLEAKAKPGSPNVLYILWDDVGIATMDCFGGLVETPNMNRIADMGLRYTQWHTTALCSPTRSCLLNGRNAHNNGMAVIEEATSGYPGKHGHIPFENALLSEILVERGYNTYALGKWHLCPADEMNLASTKSNWPLGRGFERFYGFLGGETNQWYPDLVYDNHPIDQPTSPEKGYHFSSDIVDKAIEFVADAKQVAPDKPFFMYFCPGAMHAPHHAPKEWIDKYKGKFDEGYEKYREDAFKKMKTMGIMPQDTEMSPLNPMREGRFSPLDYVKPWNSLSVKEKKLFARMAEVYAGFMSYTDHQIGRLLDYLEESDQLENTIVVVGSDNGASGEGSPDGSVNENRFFNNWPDSLDDNLKMLDKLGSPETYGHFPTGWAAAFCTPFKMFKRFSYNGGIADPLIISWPKGIKDKGGIRHQYHHAIDIAPTILESLGVAPPEYVKGYPQSPIQGKSMAYTFDNPDDNTTRKTQYYEMLGQRGIYHDGWKAVTDHGPISGIGNFMDDKWELYHVDEDRSETKNVAEKYPEKLEELIGLWWHEAGKNNVLPLDDRSPLEILGQERPQMTAPRNSYTYYPNTADVPEFSAVNIRNRSFVIKAELDIDSDSAEGVVFAHGARFGGHSLFIKNNKLYYSNNFIGVEEQKFVSRTKVPKGKLRLVAAFTKRSEKPKGVANGNLEMYINGQSVASGPMRTQPGYFSLVGDGLVVGRDSGDPVSNEYNAPFKFTGGKIHNVTVDVSGDEYKDIEQEARAMMKRD